MHVSVEKLCEGVYLCSGDEIRPLFTALKPYSMDGGKTWKCSMCGGVVEYKSDEICPECHRAVDWRKIEHEHT